MWVRWALPVLAACGRLGFDPGAGSRDAPPFDAPPGLITITLTGGPLDTNAGLPIADGYVVFVDEHGPTVVRTDAAGRAVFEAVGGTDVHVAHEPEVALLDWRVITFEGVGGGTDLVIGGPALLDAPTSDLTVDLPLEPGTAFYSVSGPPRCLNIDSHFDVPSFPVTFAETCRAETHPLFGEADAPGGGLAAWLELGAITLTPGATVTASGSWQPPTIYQVEVDGVTGEFLCGLLRSSDGLAIGEGSLTGSGPIAIAAIGVPADRLLTVIFDQTTSSIQASLAPLPAPDVMGIRHVVPAELLPAIRDVSYDPEAKMITWQQATGPSRDPVVASAYTTFTGPRGDAISWSIHARAPTLELGFAGLPVELDRIAPPTTFDQLAVSLTEVLGESYDSSVGLLARAPDVPLVVHQQAEPIDHFMSLGSIEGTSVRTAAGRLFSGVGSRPRARARRPAR